MFVAVHRVAMTVRLEFSMNKSGAAALLSSGETLWPAKGRESVRPSDSATPLIRSTT